MLGQLLAPLPILQLDLDGSLQASQVEQLAAAASAFAPAASHAGMPTHTLAVLWAAGTSLRRAPRLSGQTPCLETLLLMDNPGMTMGGGECVSGLARLRELNLRNTAVGSLASSWLHSVPALALLQLENAQITAVALTQPLPGLLKLNLGSNSIAALPPAPFAVAPALTTLYLDANRLSTLEKSLLEGVQLELFSCGAGKLTTIAPDFLSGQRRLKDFSIADAAVTAIDARLFANQSRLETLSLSYNPIVSLPPTVFDGLTRLRLCYLSFLYLTTIPADIFHALTSLHTLHLSANYFRTLPRNLFQSQTNLAELQRRHHPLLSHPGARTVRRDRGARPPQGGRHPAGCGAGLFPGRRQRSA